MSKYFPFSPSLYQVASRESWARSRDRNITGDERTPIVFGHMLTLSLVKRSPVRLLALDGEILDCVAPRARMLLL